MQESPNVEKIALVGPCCRRDGNSESFTLHLAGALRQLHPAMQVLLVDTSIPHDRGGLPYPARPALVAGREESYFATAHYLNKPGRKVDVVVLQPNGDLGEGKDGVRIRELLAALTVPVVTILPPLNRNPPQSLCGTIKELAQLSDRMVVTNQEDRAFLHDRCDAEARQTDVIPHPPVRGTLQEGVSAHMKDVPGSPGGAETPTGSPDAAGNGKTTWATVAESYKHSFVRAINGARSGRGTNRIQAWHWYRSHEYNMSAGGKPGWDI